VRPTARRIEDLGRYHRYVVSLDGVDGEIICLPELVDDAIVEMVHELAALRSIQ
jgi:hypothetical protein